MAHCCARKFQIAANFAQSNMSFAIPTHYRASSNTRTEDDLHGSFPVEDNRCVQDISHYSFVRDANGTPTYDATSSNARFAPPAPVASFAHVLPAKWTASVPVSTLRRRRRCHHSTVAVAHANSKIQTVRLSLKFST